MSSKVEKPKSKLKAFKPKKGIQIGPDEPSPEELANDLTTAVAQPAAGPRMFGRRAETEKAVKTKPVVSTPVAPRRNTTARANRPKPAFLAPVAPEPAQPKVNDILAAITGAAPPEPEPEQEEESPEEEPELTRPSICDTDPTAEVCLLPKVVLKIGPYS